MIELLLSLAGATQGPIITRLPPVMPVPMEVVPIARNLPDLAIGEIRVLDGSRIEVEIANRGRAATAGPVRMHACVYFGAQPNNTYSVINCSADLIVGQLAAGQSRRITVDCFYDKGRLAPGTAGGGWLGGSSPSYTYVAPACDNVGDPFARLEVAKYSATVDPYVWPHADPRLPLPSELKREECSYDYGCVKESNEKNNRRELDIPAPERG